MNEAEGRAVIFEITRIANAQRVAAIDTHTGLEVVVQAPLSAARADVEALALRKLERALAAREAGARRPRPGTIV